jgi:hypothetical protein
MVKSRPHSKSRLDPRNGGLAGEFANEAKFMERSIQIGIEGCILRPSRYGRPKGRSCSEVTGRIATISSVQIKPIHPP